MGKIVFWLMLICWGLPGMLLALDCSVCGKGISGKYLSSKGKSYCSQKCYSTTLPRCAHCRKRSKTFFSLKDGRKYCSRECLRTIMPACIACGIKTEKAVTMVDINRQKAVFCPDCRKTSRCYFCNLPAGNHLRLEDNRVLCRSCAGSAVTDHQKIREIFAEVRAELAREFGFDNTHSIELFIVDLPALAQQVKTTRGSSGHGKHIGFMRYSRKIRRTTYSDGRVETKVKSENCRIYVLHTIPLDFLTQTLAHELTHDHLRHHVGRVQDTASEEGFCELIASLYNIRKGKEYMNVSKEHNPSPIYGDGYRKMLDIYRKNQSISETMNHVR